MKGLKQLSLAVLVLVVLAPNATALTLETHYIGGAPPANAAGGGDLANVFNAAARIWEAAYGDEVTITLNFGWAPVGDAGTHTLIEQGGFPNREINGLILFDNSGAVAFFLDPTPASNEEYGRRTDESQNLGGGFINVARIFRDPAGNAVGRTDLLSVAIHEIGHALGICAANVAFMDEARDGRIQVTGDLPFARTLIPLAANRSGITSHFDPLAVTYGSVMSGIGADERRIPSALDILANAQISGFSNVNLDPQSAMPSIVTSTSGVGRAGAGSSMPRK